MPEKPAASRASNTDAHASWRIAVALGVAQVVSWGSIYYAFSLLIDPLANAVAADKTVVVGAFSAALLVAGLLSSPVGALIDRHGGRWVMTAGSLLATVLLAALAHVHSVVQLYLVWAGLGAAMAATLYDPAFAVLVQVFKGRQRQAITLVTLFGGFASTVFWPLTQALVQHIGWQRALLVLALINFLVCVPLHGLVLPRRSPDAPSLAGLSANTASPQLLRDPIFYGLCIAFTGNALVYSAMAVHLIPVLHAKGMTVAQAAWIGALIGPMQVLGRLLEYGFLARTSPSRVGALAMWLLPMALVLLSVLSGPSAWFLLFALFYGMGNGVMTIVRGALPAEIYGRSNYGAVNGAMAAPVLFARAAGPIAAALVMASFASPAQTVWLMALVGALSSVLFVATLARRPGAARSA